MWQEYYQYYKQEYIFIQKKTTFQVKSQQTRVYLYKYCCIITSYKLLTLSNSFINSILKCFHVCIYVDFPCKLQ